MSLEQSSLRAATPDRALSTSHSGKALATHCHCRGQRRPGHADLRDCSSVVPSLPRVGEWSCFEQCRLTVTDVDAVQEYSELLGLGVLMSLGWVATLGTSGGAQFSVMDIDQSASCNPQMSVEVPDVEVAYQRAQDSGVEIVHPLRTRTGACAASSCAQALATW